MMVETHTATANAAMARKFFMEQDRLRGALAPELCAPGYQAFLGGNPAMDRAGHDLFGQAFYTAFEGIHHTLVDVFATDDKAAVRFVLKGTHTGDFFGVPASGNVITVYANVLMHIAHGQVTTLWGLFDEAGLFRQMGART